MEKFICKYCGKEFNGKGVCVNHEKHWCKENPDVVYVDYKRSEVHKGRKKEKSWSCICGERFFTRKELKEHRKECKVYQEAIAKYGCGSGIYAHPQPHVEKDCPFCGKHLDTTQSGFTLHTKYCEKNPNRIAYVQHPQSEKSRKKISESMKKAHAEGRAGIWPGRKKVASSYPERWTIKMLKNEFGMEEGVSYIKELPFHGFFLDFAWPKTKLCLEIDGEQHQRFEDQKERDHRKDALLKEEGWKEIRADWQWIFHNSTKFVELLRNGFSNYDFEEINKESALFIEEREKQREVKETRKKRETSSERKEALKKKKEEKRLLLEKARQEGKLDIKGHISASKLSNEEVEERKSLILNCGVDLKKFGWITKVIKATGLTKRQIYCIIDKGILDCFKEAK